MLEKLKKSFSIIISFLYKYCLINIIYPSIILIVLFICWFIQKLPTLFKTFIIKNAFQFFKHLFAINNILKIYFWFWNYLFVIKKRTKYFFISKKKSWKKNLLAIIVFSIRGIIKMIIRFHLLFLIIIILNNWNLPNSNLSCNRKSICLFIS